MAGAGGFEPPNAGIKIRCLTTWRRPKSLMSNPATPRVADHTSPGPAFQRSALGQRTASSGNESRPTCPGWRRNSRGLFRADESLLRHRGAAVIRTSPLRSGIVRGHRRVAQPGRALRSGRRGRRFESSLSDQTQSWRELLCYVEYRQLSNKSAPGLEPEFRSRSVSRCPFRYLKRGSTVQAHQQMMREFAEGIIPRSHNHDSIPRFGKLNQARATFISCDK